MVRCQRTRMIDQIGPDRRLKALCVLAVLITAALGLAGLRASPAHASAPGPVVSEADGWDQECTLDPGQIEHIFDAYTSIWWFGFYLDAENAGAWTTGQCPDQTAYTSAADIEDDASHGVGLAPLYVGLQDPCNADLGWSTFSTSTSTATAQGEDDAATAWDETQDLGFAGNAYIYFDLEAYDTGNSTCNNAAAAFITGWDSELKALGAHPGVYGSACSSDLANFRNDSPDPQAIWPAWYSDPSHTSVYGLSAACSGSSQAISDGWWDHNQRIVQWTDEGALSTNGVSNNDTPVDYDCADGPVMDISYGPGVTLGSGCKGDQ
jgi:hypothetical protein